MDVNATQRILSNCVLCPAGCRFGMVPTGPDAWRSGYPTEASGGLCPRGAVLGELVGHRRRILAPAVREQGRLRPVAMAEAIDRVRQAASVKDVTIFLDGNVPCEEMAAAAGWRHGWDRGSICLVIEPADRDLLIGTEASGADYLGEDALKECDGFLIVGDPFAANPICSRGVMERRAAQPRTPIAVIDPGFGTAAKFATHSVAAASGMELVALSQLATAAGVSDGAAAAGAAAIPSAAAAGEALAGCEKLGVLVSAEYGRCADWRRIGYLCGLLAKACGGAVAPQTVGANALAAVRLEAQWKTLPLAEALKRDGLKVAVGCDLLGMLGWADGDPSGPLGGQVQVAAAALPNCTVDAAEVVLPVAMTGEISGTYLLSGGRRTEVTAAIAAPSGVPTPGELVGLLASACGASKGRAEAFDLARLPDAAPSAAPDAGEPAGALLFAREAIHSGCGDLTGHASWAAALRDLPQLRLSPSYASELAVRNLAEIVIRAGSRTCRARVRTAPELPAGVMVLTEGSALIRALAPCRADGDGNLIATPVVAEVKT